MQLIVLLTLCLILIKILKKIQLQSWYFMLLCRGRQARIPEMIALLLVLLRLGVLERIRLGCP
jgi:hypothetical protein